MPLSKDGEIIVLALELTDVRPSPEEVVDSGVALSHAASAKKQMQAIGLTEKVIILISFGVLFVVVTEYVRCGDASYK